MSPVTQRAGRRASAGMCVVMTLSVGATACDPSEIAPLDNPLPIVEAIEPAVVVRGSATSIGIRGLGFVEGAEARWNGEARVTTFVDANHLTLSLTAQDLEATGGEIDAVNPPPGGGASESVVLAVLNPAPTITSLSPASAPAVVTPELTLQVQGSGFVSGSPGTRLLWDGVPLGTTVTSATELSAAVPDYLLRVGRTAVVTVSNPDPGGGESAPRSFAVENPVPLVTGLDPSSFEEESGGELQVEGTGFVFGASVWIGSTSLSPTFVSGTRVIVEVPPSLIPAPGTFQVRVENPGPVGGASNEWDLLISPAPPIPPAIDYLVPSLVLAGSAGFTLTIHGAEFDLDATVTWNGDPRTVRILSSSRIEMDVPAADVASVGSVEIVVANPGTPDEAATQLGIVSSSPYVDRVVAERWGTLSIFSSRPDGSQQTSVAIPGGGARVDASPTDHKAVYHSDAGRVFEVDFETSSIRRVTTAADELVIAEEAWPRYSADGAWIYFQAVHLGESEIWRARADGTGAEPVVGDQPARYPAPSHDGTRIVYAASGGQLRVHDLGTSSSTALGVVGLNSRWSPTDDWIVYLTPSWDLRAVRPDGTGDFALVTSVDVGFGFDFSVDGSTIVATSQSGAGLQIAFPSGTVGSLPGLGQIGSVAWFGP